MIVICLSGALIGALFYGVNLAEGVAYGWTVKRHITAILLLAITLALGASVVVLGGWA